MDKLIKLLLMLEHCKTQEGEKLFVMHSVLLSRLQISIEDLQCMIVLDSRSSPARGTSLIEENFSRPGMALKNHHQKEGREREEKSVIDHQKREFLSDLMLPAFNGPCG